jgi:glycosyltransferase involved in cell wall biosynthesis
MRVLIYNHTNARAVDLQSVMELFVKMGHEVFLFSQLPKGDLHRNVEKYGVKVFGTDRKKNNGLGSYLYNVRALRKFIKEHKIEIVFAHLQGAGFVAGIVRKFTRFKLFYIRHNTDEHIIQNNRNAKVLNWLTNSVTNTIIAPSEKVYNYITQVEGVSSSRVLRINYGYNFNQYLETDRTGIAKSIRSEYNCRLLLLSVARLVPAKRHMLMFEAVKKLAEKKCDVKLVCISDGPFRVQLEEYINKEGLQKHVFLIGSRKNVFDYLEAADVFFHLSETEASNSAVKEAGYCKRTAIVCSGVGDFDDYIENGINGYLLNKTNPVAGAINALEELYNDAGKVKRMGELLHDTIISEFEINNVRSKYEKLLN